MSVARETYWRVFSTELNQAEFEIKADEDMKPSYQLSRLGAMISRVLITGVLTEKEDVGSPDEPMWRGRIQDIAGGTIFINIGRFQPEAASAIATIDTPSIVAVLGKVKSYTNDEGRTFISVRPERIFPISNDVQQQWLLDTAKTTWERLVAMKKVLKNGGDKIDGMPETQYKNICLAIDQYGQPDSNAYIRAIQTSLRTLLPELNVDFGIPGDMPEGPEEVDIDAMAEEYGAGAGAAAPTAPAPSTSDDDREEFVLRMLTELNDGKGAPRDLLESRCAEEGISSMDLEEIIEGLLDKGLAYEPNLKYIKKIDD